MTGPMVTLATGEAVSSSSPQWRDECFARWQRVVSMRPMSIGARRALLDEVEAKEGGLARTRLENEFATDWKARKGAV
jgi:hypothetical protein